MSSDPTGDRLWLESSLKRLSKAQTVEDIETLRDELLSTLGDGHRGESNRDQFLNRVNLRLVTEFRTGSLTQALDFGISRSAAAVRDVLDREAGATELALAVLDLVRVVERAALKPDSVERVQDFFAESLDVIASHSLEVAEVSMHALGVAALSLAQNPLNGERRRFWAECALDHFAHAEGYARQAPDGSQLKRGDSLWRAIANRCIAETIRADSELELCQAFEGWATLLKAMARQPATWQKYRDGLAPGFFAIVSAAVKRVGVEPGDIPGYRLQLWRLAGGPWFEALMPSATGVAAPGHWADALLVQERDALVAAIRPTVSNLQDLDPERLQVEAGERVSPYLGALLMGAGYPPGLLSFILGDPDGEAVDDFLEALGHGLQSATGVPADLQIEGHLARLRMRLMIGDEENRGEYRTAARSHLDYAAGVYGADVALGAFFSAQRALIRNAASTEVAIDAANDALDVARAHREREDYADTVAWITREVENRATTSKQADWFATIGTMREALLESDRSTGVAARSPTQSESAQPSQLPEAAYSSESSVQVRLALAKGDLQAAVAHALVAWRQTGVQKDERALHAGFLLRMHELGAVTGLTNGEYLRLVRDTYVSIDDKHLALPGMVETLVVLLGLPRSQTGITQAESDDLALRVRRAYAASPLRDEVPEELKVLITAPTQRTSADSLRTVAAARNPHVDERTLRGALITLMRLINSGDAAGAGFDEIHKMCVELYNAHAGSRSSAVVRDLTYLVGESARRSGNLEVARHYLSQVMQLPDLGAAHQGYEADYAQLAIAEAVETGDLAEALFWLERVRALTELGTLGDVMLVNLGGAVVRVASMAGVDEVRALAVEVEARLREYADRSTGAERAKAEIIRAKIALLDKEASTTVEAIQRLGEVLRESLARPLEAAVRRQRILASFIANTTSAMREDFERLTYLQDQELLHHTGGGIYEDLLGEEPLRIALWAIQAGDIELAIDALERGRMRYLFFLQAEGSGVHIPNQGAEAQRLLAKDWGDYFIPLSASGVRERSMDRPIVYVFGVAGMLTLLGLSKGKAITVTVVRYGSESEGWEPPVTRFWRDLALEWVPADIVPVVIDNGVTPQELLTIDRSYIDAQVGTPRLGRPTHLPSARFVVADGAPDPATAPALLHIGDDSGTLIGPWLEAAWLSERYPGPLTSLVGQSAATQQASIAMGAGSTLIASCHGSFVEDGSHFRLGIGDGGLSLSDLFSTDWLAAVDNVVLAACDSGATAKGPWRRDALSAANAALVAGAKCVVAPATPVNDLVSAFFVCSLTLKLGAHDFATAMDLTLKELAALTASEFVEDLHVLWDTLWNSDLIERMPWSPTHAEAAFWRLTAEAVATEQWRRLPFVVLDGRRYSAVDHAPQTL